MTNSLPYRSLAEQLWLECEAMAKYAFASGLKVPASTVQLLEVLMQERPVSQSAEFSAESGSNRKIFKQLAHLHEQLAQIIKPALPACVLFLQIEESRHTLLQFLGPVPLVRRMMLVSTFALICFIWLSTFPEVNGKVDWIMDSGHKLLLNELFVVTAAALGASFSSLFKIHQFIRAGTFNHKFEYFAWIRLSLGIVAGAILAILIPMDDSAATLTKPLLSMLGGFSVELVHILLERMIVTVGTLVNGDNQGAVSIEVQNAQVKADEQKIKNQLQIAAKLMNLRAQLESSNDKEQLRNALDQLLTEFIPAEFVQSVANNANTVSEAAETKN